MDQESVFLRRELLRLKNTDQSRLFRHPPPDSSAVVAHDKVRKADLQLWQRSRDLREAQAHSPKRSHGYTNGSALLNSRHQRSQHDRFDGAATVVSPPIRLKRDESTNRSMSKSQKKTDYGFAMGEGEANVSQQQLRALQLVDALRDSILSTSQPPPDDDDDYGTPVETKRKLKRKGNRVRGDACAQQLDERDREGVNDDEYFEQMRRSYFECSQQLLDEIERQLKHNTSHHLKTQ